MELKIDSVLPGALPGRFEWEPADHDAFVISGFARAHAESRVRAASWQQLDLHAITGLLLAGAVAAAGERQTASVAFVSLFDLETDLVRLAETKVAEVRTSHENADGGTSAECRVPLSERLRSVIRTFWTSCDQLVVAIASELPDGDVIAAMEGRRQFVIASDAALFGKHFDHDVFFAVVPRLRTNWTDLFQSAVRQSPEWPA